MNRKLLAMICSLSPLVAWAAGGQPLDIKTGLWEITRITEMSGAPPIPADVLAQMPPERRAQMERMLQQRQAQGPKVQSSKSCITQDELEQPFQANDDEEGHCQHTLVNHSRSMQDVHFECSDDKKQRMSSGDFHIQALDREHIKGIIKMTSSSGEHPMKMNMEMSGKWLGKDCGAEK